MEREKDMWLCTDEREQRLLTVLMPSGKTDGCGCYGCGVEIEERYNDVGIEERYVALYWCLELEER